MYYAKSNGRNNIVLFSQDMNQAVLARLQLERDLQLALEQSQFELHYQPKIDAKTEQVVGFEALVRWRHPVEGLIAPALFIPVAESTGQILMLGAWVIDEACRQLAEWRRAGFAEVSVAINLSAHQLRSATLLTDVYLALESNKLKPTDIELEVTESVAIEDVVGSIGQINALRILGVQLAIDDFGTGYSSLSNLKQLPVQCLKLDQSFVRDIETDRNDALICEATINLAHGLNLTVVAEGVETDAQRQFLTAAGCDIFQGFFYSRPLPAAQALEYMQSWNKRRPFR